MIRSARTVTMSLPRGRWTPFPGCRPGQIGKVQIIIPNGPWVTRPPRRRALSAGWPRWARWRVIVGRCGGAGRASSVIVGRWGQPATRTSHAHGRNRPGANAWVRWGWRSERLGVVAGRARRLRAGWDAVRWDGVVGAVRTR